MLLEQRPFRRFFIGQMVSMLGDNIAPATIVLATLAIYHSAVEGGFVLAASAASMVLFTLPAGVWADRLPRKNLMILSDLIRCVAQAATAVLLLSGHPNLTLLLLAQFLFGVGDALFYPASSGLMPQLVKSPDLAAANGLFGTASSAMRVAGPLVAALIIISGSPALAVACDAMSFLVSAAFLARVAVTLHIEKLETAESFLTQLAIGFRELRSRRWACVTIVYLTLLTFSVNAPIAVLGPAVAQSRLGGPVAWTFMLTAFGVGTIVGSLLGMRKQTAHSIVLCLAAMLTNLPLQLQLAMGSNLLLFCAATALAGVGSGFFVVQWMTLLQERLPPRILSRISSYKWLGTVALYPIGLATVAPVANILGESKFMMLTAAYLAISTIVAIAVVGAKPVVAPAEAPAGGLT